jgi:hypothetical protein
MDSKKVTDEGYKKIAIAISPALQRSVTIVQ